MPPIAQTFHTQHIQSHIGLYIFYQIVVSLLCIFLAHAMNMHSQRYLLCDKDKRKAHIPLASSTDPAPPSKEHKLQTKDLRRYFTVEALSCLASAALACSAKKIKAKCNVSTEIVIAGHSAIIKLACGSMMQCRGMHACRSCCMQCVAYFKRINNGRNRAKQG